MRKQRSRRDVLRALGAGTTVGMAALAGCTSNSDAGMGSSSNAGPATGDSDSTGSAARSKTTLTDMAGRSVMIPDVVKRVVALGSSGLRFVTYAGGAEKVVGVEQLETTSQKRPYRPYTLAHDRYTTLPSVGSRKSPGPERILKLNSDVIVYAYASASDADRMQQKTGVPTVVIRPGGLTPTLRDQFFDALSLTGRVLGTSKTAADLRHYVTETIADLKRRRKAVENEPTGYIGYLGRGKHGLTFTQPSYVPFELGGVTNVATNATGGGSRSGDGNGDGSGSGGGGGGGGGSGGQKGATRVEIDPEALIKWNPSYLFVDLGTETYEELSAPEYQSIAAIETGNVYGVLPTRDYGTNFGTVLADAYYVGSVSNPKAFDVNPSAKANEIYEAFVGEGVYRAVADGYGRGFGKLAI